MMKGDAWPKRIRGVVFDNDGLLMDTEPVIGRALRAAAGCDIPPELKQAILGRTTDDACKIIVEKLALSCGPDEFDRRWDCELEKYWPLVELFDGAMEIVDYFIGKGVPVAIATSAPRDNHETKTQRHSDFFGKFSSIITGDDVQRGKPDPEIYLRSMRALGLSDPSSVLVFEDAPSGVRAANVAGMPVVMIPAEGAGLAGELEYGAVPDYVFRSLREVDLRLFMLDAAGA